MSRTYRKTSIHQGSPRNWGKRWIAQMNTSDTSKPDNYRHWRPAYRRYEEQVTITYDRYDCPKSERIYVNKGTPHAIEEKGELIVHNDAWRRNWSYFRTSKWYLLPPPRVVTRKRKILINVRYTADYDRDAYHTSVAKAYLFDHVHKNKSGRKHKSHAFYKREKVTAIRRTGEEYIRNWEDEYHLNQHLEPRSYILDDWDDWINEQEAMWDDEDDDFGCESWNDWHVEPDKTYDYDFDYYPEYDDWD